MKKKLLPIFLMSLLLLLSACRAGDTGQPDTDPGGTSLSEQPGASENGSEQSETTPPETEPPTQPPTEVAQIADGRLLVVQTGRYSGLNPENGADEQTENVAALLVLNSSEQVCQFCTLEYTIDGETALFNLSELPAGKAAWVLESTGMTVGEDAEFQYESETSVFRDEDAAWLSDIAASGGDGKLTVTNQGETDQPTLTVYYKLTYGENTYLGGIAYRVTVSDLKAGESQTLPAGHFYEGACEIVGIYPDGAA